MASPAISRRFLGHAVLLLAAVASIATERPESDDDDYEPIDECYNRDDCGVRSVCVEGSCVECESTCDNCGQGEVCVFGVQGIGCPVCMAEATEPPCPGECLAGECGSDSFCVEMYTGFCNECAPASTECDRECGTDNVCVTFPGESLTACRPVIDRESCGDCLSDFVCPETTACISSDEFLCNGCLTLVPDSWFGVEDGGPPSDGDGTADGGPVGDGAPASGDPN